MSDIDIFEKKLDKIQTCQEKFRHNLDKFRTHTKFYKFSKNLDKFRTPRFTDVVLPCPGVQDSKKNDHRMSVELVCTAMMSVYAPFMAVYGHSSQNPMHLDKAVQGCLRLDVLYHDF